MGVGLAILLIDVIEVAANNAVEVWTPIPKLHIKFSFEEACQKTDYDDRWQTCRH